MTMLRTTDCHELLDFGEVQRRLQLGPRTDIGTHEIAIEQVIGSVGRTSEFDGCFRPRTKRLRDILYQIRATRPDAANTAILVYQVDHAYFVVDGHKRLALAIEEGRQFIDAEVGWFPSRFHLSRGTTMDEIRSTALERRFREITGLAAAVPEARFPLADPDAFLELEESVLSHAYKLSQHFGRVVEPSEAASHWYEHVFAPSVAVAKESRLHWVLHSCTEAELFLVLRRGSHETWVEDVWDFPEAYVERGLENLRRAEPGPIQGAIARVRGRSREVARVLPDADVRIDEPSTDGEGPSMLPTRIVRRPRREADSPG